MAETDTGPAGGAGTEQQVTHHTVEFLDNRHRPVEIRDIEAATLGDTLDRLAGKALPPGAVKLWIEPKEEGR